MGSGICPRSGACIRAWGCRDQLVYLARLCGRTTWACDRSVDRWIERLGLADRVSDLDTLSHGNQQRVQLIAALVNDPELLVLDEPFSRLDPIAIVDMIELLAEVAAAGATVLFSSHQLDLVEDLCEDVVIIDHGRIVLAGELTELREAVPQRFVNIRFQGAIPDWSELPSVDLVESEEGRPACVSTAISTWPGGGGPAPDHGHRLVRLPALDAVGSSSAGRWRHERPAPGWLVAVREDARARGRRVPRFCW